MCTPSSMILLLAVCCLLGPGGWGGTLTWNGGASGVWNKTDANWLDAESRSVAWTDGETAVVATAGATLNVTEEIAVNGISLASGVVVGGAGDLLLGGDVSVAASATASLSLPVWARTDLAKTGAGDLVANMLVGPITVSGGRLLTGGLHANRAAVTEDGGTVVWQTGDASATNLISNGSFETGAAAGNYVYVKGSSMPTGWDNPSSSFFVLVREGGAGSGVWGIGGALGIPDGLVVAGFQRNASASQTVTVPSDGLYELSYVSFKRSSMNNDDHFLGVSVDGVPRFMQDTVWYVFDASCDDKTLVRSGPIWLTAGSHVIGFQGVERWGDRTTFVDDVKLLACTAGSAPVTAVRETLVADDATAVPALTYTNVLAFLTKTGAGATSLAGTLTLLSDRNTHLTANGALTLTGPVTGGGSACFLAKRGPGTVTLAGGYSGVSWFDVYGGTLGVTVGGKLPFRLHARDGVEPTLLLTLTNNPSFNVWPQLLGPGTVNLRTAGTGHTLTLGGTLQTAAAGIRLGVGAGDTLNVQTFRPIVYSGSDFPSAIVLDGPGTLRLTESASADRLPRGSLAVQAGTLALAVNDLAKGVAHPITGTVTADPALLGDLELVLAPSASAASATPRLLLDANLVAVARTVTVGAGGASATLEGRTGTTRLDAVALGRAETRAVAGTDAELRIGSLARAADYTAGTAVLAASGAGTVVLETAPGAGTGVAVASGATVRFGRDAALATVCDSLALDGALEVGFTSGAWDTFTVGTLALGAAPEIRLRDDATGDAFGQVGRYTLFTYGTLTGDPAALTIPADCRVEDYDYAFVHDAAAKTITLVVTASASSPLYTWTALGGGVWTEGTNWDRASAPDGATHVAVFGSAATSAATVTGAGATLAGLRFANTNGYTLTGGTLTFAPAADGTRPEVRADFGTHTLAGTLTTSDGGALEVAGTKQGKVVLDGAVNVPVVAKGAVSLGANAALAAAFTTATGGTFNVGGATTLGAGDTSVNLLGGLSGAGTLTKEGTGAFTLAGDAHADRSFSGTIRVQAGSLALGLPALANGTVDLAAGTTLMPAATGEHGLVGTFRALPLNTNFKTLAGKLRSLATFRSSVATLPVVTNVFFTGTAFTVADSDASAPTLPADCLNGAGGSQENYWVAEWEGVFDAPASGEYLFRADVDDGFVLALDGETKLLSEGCCSAVRSVRIEKGPHALYLGLYDQTAKASLRIQVKAPGASAFADLPMAWLRPAAGVHNLTGLGTVSVPADAALAVCQETGFDTAFAGTLAGAGTFVKTGPGRFGVNHRTGSGDLVLASGGLDVVAANGAGAFGALAAGADGMLGVLGASGVASLYGPGSVTFGEGAFWTKLTTADAACGLSTNRTYTHLLSFPVTGACNGNPEVNGVTFNTVGTGAYSIANKPSQVKVDTKVTGFQSVFDEFLYASTDYTVTLTGLTPNAAYEFRFYWMNYGANSERSGTFTFTTSDGGTARTIAKRRQVLEGANHATSRGSEYDVLSCRYRAGSDGNLKVRVQSGTGTDTVHLYAVSNELLEGNPNAANALTLAPAEGERNVLKGDLAGGASVTVGGAGEQAFGGAIDLGAPLAVTGHLILQKGASANSGVNVAAGATLELRGGATVKGLAGTGTVTLPFGDRRPYGALQADGTFAAPANFRITTFTGDADCGLSPSKEYLCAFDYRGNGNNNTPTVVNEVPFRQASPGEMKDVLLDTTLNSYDVFTKGMIVGVPPSTHAGANFANIGIPSTEKIYEMLKGMNYSGGKSVQRTLHLGGLTTGATYELRFYERTWDKGTATKRRLRLQFQSTGAVAKTTLDNDHTVQIDGVGRTADGTACLPYTIDVRFTACAPSNNVWYTSLDNDAWHLYGASLERVDVAAHVRTLDLAADTTFAGSVGGVGEVAKTGAGTLTLAGDVAASGFWTVKGGALLLTDAAQTLGCVAVTNATFGGVGAVTDDLGVAGTNAVLVLGGENGGTLAVGGLLALGEGTTVRITGAGANTGRATAGTLALPAALTVRPVRKLSGSCTLFTAASGDLTGFDFGGWTVLKADGVTRDRAARLAVSVDGKSVALTANTGTVLLFR